jgi:RimJ/RimL family protein N-acetyltransferase
VTIFHYPYSEKDAEQFFAYIDNNDAEQVFGIEFRGDLCGVVSLTVQKDVHKHSAEIGYWIGEAFWANGIATKAISLMTDFGFAKLGLKRIYAIVFENNIASMRALEKNGYQLEGILKKAIQKNAQLLDEYRFYKLNL